MTTVNTINVYAEDSVITVYYNRVTGQVNKNIFGSAFLGHELDPKYRSRYYNADYGRGIWNPDQDKPVNEAIRLAREAGLSSMRFTGSNYNWKNAIEKKREHFLFGIDEFMKTMKAIKAEPVIIVSYFVGNDQDAADLVEYLNAPNDPKYPWAEKRAGNGHPAPYGVKYFEFGNEVFVHEHVKPEKYASKYNAYQKVMKNIDASIKLGLNLHHYDWRWDRKVLEVAGNNVDFVIKHIYPPKDLGYYTSTNDYNTDTLFEVILGSLVVYTEEQFINTQNIIKEITGREDVYHAITEYNIGLEQREPQYRFSLGASLVNAELLRIFMKPANKVMIANNWNFINEYWGMIKSEEQFTKQNYQEPTHYVKRPNYYVYELYNKHFGDLLIDVDIKGSEYNIDKYNRYMRALINKKTDRTLLQYEWLDNKWFNRIKRTVMRTFYELEGDGSVAGENLLTDDWKIRKTPGVITDNEDGMLKVHFKNPEDFNYYHSTKHTAVEPSTYYKLSGYIKTKKLIDKKGVSLEVLDGRGWKETHSAAHTTEIAGSVDWKYVEVVYKTLPDSKSVAVRTRRVGPEGTLKGKAYFKDVKLQKYLPPDTLLTYLTVNASKNKKGNKIYLMVINKNMKEAITSLIELRDSSTAEDITTAFNSKSLQINAWILNGPSIMVTNEELAFNVTTYHKYIEKKTNPFKLIFEPHSLTAIEIEIMDN